MKLKHQMDIDEQVYIGDTSARAEGPAQLAASPTRQRGERRRRLAAVVNKTPDEILADVNEVLTACWAALAGP
jgi:hypothetical protein